MRIISMTFTWYKYDEQLVLKTICALFAKNTNLNGGQKRLISVTWILSPALNLNQEFKSKKAQTNVWSRGALEERAMTAVDKTAGSEH